MTKELRKKAGLLPLHLALYDEKLPAMREVLEPFLRDVAERLRSAGMDVVVADICRLSSETQRAVATFEAEGVDAIITLHLAYSPSLESCDALAGTKLPVIICDTTLDASFNQQTQFLRLLYNHGVHGVMDLTSMLKRRGKRFEIVAGHVGESDVISRTAALVGAAKAAHQFRHTRALRIGETFAGMGDFAPGDDVLTRELGMNITTLNVADLIPLAAQITVTELAAENAQDHAQFDVRASEAVLTRSNRVGLAVRRLLNQGGYHAFSMNFSNFIYSEEPVNTVPFLECSKAMGRGMGYAGEGDLLTAALVGALSQGFGRTNFVEIFCPDWRGNSLFMNHMGEVNVGTLEGRPTVYEKDYKYSAALNPAIVTGPWQKGDAVLVNVLRGPDAFELIVAPVEVLDDATDPSMAAQIRGWIRPQRRSIADFLETYSRYGGTHHKALVYGQSVETLRSFGEFAGLLTHVI